MKKYRKTTDMAGTATTPDALRALALSCRRLAKVAYALRGMVAGNPELSGGKSQKRLTASLIDIRNRAGMIAGIADVVAKGIDGDANERDAAHAVLVDMIGKNDEIAESISALFAAIQFAVVLGAGGDDMESLAEGAVVKTPWPDDDTGEVN